MTQLDVREVTRRAEHAFTIPLGSVVHEAKSDDPYVFLGWMVNTVGRLPLFARCVTGKTIRDYRQLYHYNCAIASTLERKFPDVARFRNEKSD